MAEKYCRWEMGTAIWQPWEELDLEGTYGDGNSRKGFKKELWKPGCSGKDRLKRL